MRCFSVACLNIFITVTYSYRYSNGCSCSCCSSRGCNGHSYSWLWFGGCRVVVVLAIFSGNIIPLFEEEEWADIIRFLG